MGERTRALWAVMAMAARADPRRAGAAVAAALAAAVVTAAQALLLRDLTDAAVDTDRRAMVIAGSALVATAVVLRLVSWSAASSGAILRERASLAVGERIASTTAGIPGLAYHEHPEHLDELELLDQSAERLARLPESALANLTSVLRLALTVGLLAALHPLLVVLPLFAVPSLWAGARAQRLWYRTGKENAAGNRLHLQLYWLAALPQAGPELRIYGLGAELLSRFDTAYLDGARLERDTSVRAAAYAVAGWLVFGIGFVWAIVLVASRAAAGDAGAGDVVLALVLAGQLNSGVGGVVGGLASLLDNLDMGTRLLRLEKVAKDAAVAATPTEPAPLPVALAEGIRLEGVSFAYPGGADSVLDGIDLFLPAGSTVALVGDNGAGKTTIVKLLARLYDPTSGRITVDGVDLSHLDVASWRQCIAAGFQDFARLEFTLSETVGVGNLEQIDEQDAVMAALRAAGAQDVSDGLPDGLATRIGRSFDDGLELSTGQWQKLALGRAMMRTAPLLMILDEPTASLDAHTEHVLFERYASAAHAVGARIGGITLLVSHRFSTVRMAELIVVLGDGGILESGSHDELMARQGRYAELYSLQARAYLRH